MPQRASAGNDALAEVFGRRAAQVVVEGFCPKCEHAGARARNGGWRVDRLVNVFLRAQLRRAKNLKGRVDTIHRVRIDVIIVCDDLSKTCAGVAEALELLVVQWGAG